MFTILTIHALYRRVLQIGIIVGRLRTDFDSGLDTVINTLERVEGAAQALILELQGIRFSLRKLESRLRDM